MGIAIGIGVLISNMGKNVMSITSRNWHRKIVMLLLSNKARLRVYIALSTVALVLTHSRMGNVAFFISLTVTAICALKLTNYARKNMMILVVSIIVIDILIVSAWFGLDKVTERIEKTSIEKEMRDEVATYTIEQWKDYFITGSGGGTYKYIFPAYRGIEIKKYYDHAHNDILEFSSETGVVGISLLISIVLMSLFSAIKALSLRRDPLMIGLAFSVVMSILALSIHSFVDFNLQIPANAATFVVILALSWIAQFHSRQSN
jgi:O-antigen ligase